MFDDCELPQFYYEKIRLSRKQHKCCECAAPIKSGMKYLDVNAKWGDNIENLKQHLWCWRACKAIRDPKINGECVPFGHLFDWYHEEKWNHKKWHKRFRRRMARVLIRKRELERVE